MDPDFSIEQVDVNGDVRETANDAIEALDGHGDTRLGFLKKAGLAGGAVMGGGALLTALTPAAAMAAGKGRPPASFGKAFAIGGAWVVPAVRPDVAVVGTTAIVGGGLIPDTGYHTERYSPLGCLATSVRVAPAIEMSEPAIDETSSEPSWPNGTST
mgnify:CR=1 FL=1